MSDVKFETVEQKASYGIGLQMGQQLAGSGLEGLNVDAIAAGIATALVGEMPAIDVDEINQALQAMHMRAEEARQASAKIAAAEGENFLKDNALRPEVTVLESGLQYEIINEGTGEIPSADKSVRVHYHGELTDGTVFDSSVSRGQPAEFPVTGVIKGWVEALQLMPVGSKWKLYIPQDLAYGERGAGAAIPPFAALIFEVELLAIL
ncbi:FKBP-type peptidyl-prolyl cis-trans isomerase [Vibrio cincinnatiensis]|jgi:FKBP-type peptidyl-prolyl cis-trans isomerase FklB|uniref:Peptidyl-prolyl cis-trans isomerase n=1 Tax=Vibrio cincinnatiensis DSM 19608 TaxID=1123491 RepID=A0A1T4QVE5_VIBCI|nr:FKBP-type peptidyl-prolyl cis-trans isomerase [Vibrio cincinnatiensis]MCG3722211.1 FKBP-type peptidyl-prolyl cis-trans isomerase [Vibrio cincinnatiensis]MCG3732203.1 FKBP-type peptidyl-prolyl cis-trans isomerase [Vibrio cincinnatiensis]MCG3735801.1 FKBP-type peptidyl-prolyl cis-trans isomerase [Vibrio cincinnatiensis]MCG3739624.1 FKBP-type peptidyl-prolyl cis-trans isomerase [Vibrio cincinnatiensis]MCG3746722.1 FKBP-type peptidyl-prolyl cis-trans isomerase [Vibrio cincinnatiensis]